MFMFNNPTIEFVVPEPQIRELRFSASVTPPHFGTRSMRVTSRSEEDRGEFLEPLVLLKRQAERACLESREIHGATVYTGCAGDKGLFDGYVEQAWVNLRYHAEDLKLVAKTALLKWWAAKTVNVRVDMPLIRDLSIGYVTVDGDHHSASGLLSGLRFRTAEGLVPAIPGWQAAI